MILNTHKFTVVMLKSFLPPKTIGMTRLTQTRSILLGHRRGFISRENYRRSKIKSTCARAAKGIVYSLEMQVNYLLIIIRPRWDFSGKNLWWLCSLLYLASETMADKIDRLKIKIIPDWVVQMVRDWYPNPSGIPYMGHLWQWIKLSASWSKTKKGPP